MTEEEAHLKEVMDRNRMTPYPPVDQLIRDKQSTIPVQVVGDKTCVTCRWVTGPQERLMCANPNGMTDTSDWDRAYSITGALNRAFTQTERRELMSSCMAQRYHGWWNSRWLGRCGRGGRWWSPKT